MARRLAECDITKEMLHELFIFDFERGSLKWRHPGNNHAKLVDAEAGYYRTTERGKKYRMITINKTPFYRSRLMYLAFYGEWPMPMVDHKNRDSTDDSIGNLRPANKSENAQNSWREPRLTNGITLPIGVYPISKSRRFKAQIQANKKLIYLGSYATPEEAHIAYIEKRKELFGEFA